MRDGGLLAQDVPAVLSREGRLRLLDECAEALLDGRLPSDAARLFLGSALAAWLRDAGSRPFEAFVRVSARRGSHKTRARLYADLVAAKSVIGDDGAK
jgi:hypothetical protein